MTSALGGKGSAGAMPACCNVTSPALQDRDLTVTIGDGTRGLNQTFVQVTFARIAMIIPGESPKRFSSLGNPA